MSANLGTMRIGEVHAQLRQHFPDVELSKIRYYEDKGLVQPSRSRKGYRLYSERDVACLREAIRLAQDEFVPLRVVRLRLIEQGLLEEPSMSPSSRQVARETGASIIVAPAPPIRPSLSLVTPSPDDAGGVSEAYLTVTELLKTAGLSPEQFNQLQALGLVTPLVHEGETKYNSLDVRVATLAQPLVARGVDVRILGSLRRIAEREVGVLDELTQPLRRVGAEHAPEKVRAVTRDVASELNALRSVLLERELQRYLDNSTP